MSKGGGGGEGEGVRGASQIAPGVSPSTSGRGRGGVTDRPGGLSLRPPVVGEVTSHIAAGLSLSPPPVVGEGGFTDRPFTDRPLSLRPRS